MRRLTFRCARFAACLKAALCMRHTTLLESAACFKATLCLRHITLPTLAARHTGTKPWQPAALRSGTGGAPRRGRNSTARGAARAREQRRRLPRKNRSWARRRRWRRRANNRTAGVVFERSSFDITIARTTFQRLRHSPCDAFTVVLLDYRHIFPRVGAWPGSV